MNDCSSAAECGFGQTLSSGLQCEDAASQRLVGEIAAGTVPHGDVGALVEERHGNRLEIVPAVDLWRLEDAALHAVDEDRDQDVADAFLGFQPGVADLGRQLVAEAFRRDAFVAISARDFLDQVSLPDCAGFDVRACGRALCYQFIAFHPAGKS